MTPSDDVLRRGGIIIFPFLILFARTANEPGGVQGNHSSFVDSTYFFTHFLVDATQPHFVLAKLGGGGIQL